MKQIKIPKTVQVGGQVLEIRRPQIIDGGESAGEVHMIPGYIEVAKQVYGETQCASSSFNTYNHELVHAILYCMGEDRLYNNEKFVNTFAGFLTEARVTEKY